VNGYTETHTSQLIDLTKIERVDVVGMSEIDLPDPDRAERWDDVLRYHRWDVMVAMDDGKLITYLRGARCQSEDNPCFTKADREMSEDERDTMNQVAAELRQDIHAAKRLKEESSD